MYFSTPFPHLFYISPPFFTVIFRFSYKFREVSHFRKWLISITPFQKISHGCSCERLLKDLLSSIFWRRFSLKNSNGIHTDIKFIVFWSLRYFSFFIKLYASTHSLHEVNLWKLLSDLRFSKRILIFVIWLLFYVIFFFFPYPNKQLFEY